MISPTKKRIAGFLIGLWLLGLFGTGVPVSHAQWFARGEKGRSETPDEPAPEKVVKLFGPRTSPALNLTLDYRARNLSFSLRQDDAVREVYLRNDGVTRVDTLLIGEFIPPPKSGGFLFEKDKDLKDGLSLPPGNQIRLGTIQFTPSTTGGRTVSVTSLVFNKAKSVGSDVSPIIGGGGNPDPSGAIRGVSDTADAGG